MSIYVREALQRMSAGYFRNAPIEQWPNVGARIYGIKVPRSARVLPEKTTSVSANINIIFELLTETRDVSGDVAECGVFRGATFVPMALYLKQHGAKKMLYGFDSFEGFDEAVNIDVQLGGQADEDKRVAGFSDTSYEGLVLKLRRLGVASTAQLVKGYFCQTLPGHQDRRFSFVHLDCDIYQSYKDCLEFFYPRLEKGGVILLDEYNDPHWPGCNAAVDEFLANKPERLIEAEADNAQKWYIKKENHSPLATS